MTGVLDGDTAWRWFVYLLVLAFGVWAMTVLVSIARRLGRRARRMIRTRRPAPTPTHAQ